MTKEDKRFLQDLMQKSDQKWEARFAQTDQKLSQMDQKIDNLKTELQEEIRYNGILLEAVQDDVRLVAESVQGLNRRIAYVEEVLQIG